MSTPSSQKLKSSLLDIEFVYPAPEHHRPIYDQILATHGALLEAMLSEQLLSLIKSDMEGDNSAASLFYEQLDTALPLMTASACKSGIFPQLFSVSLLCSSKFTTGTGRYVSDVTSRLLIPGKALTIASATSLAIRFKRCQNKSYFTHHLFALIESEHDLSVAISRFEEFSREVALSIRTIQHIRQVVIQKSLSLEAKERLLEERLTSIDPNFDREGHPSLFEEARRLIMRASAEDRRSEIKEVLLPVAKKRPEIFRKDLFTEVHRSLSLLRDEFCAARDSSFLVRFLAYIYLFRKSMERGLATDQRQIHCKLLYGKVSDKNGTRPILGILLTLFLNKEREILDHPHLLSAIQSILPSAISQRDSWTADKRVGDRMRMLYLEIEKENGATFSAKERQRLREELPLEIRGRIESVTTPLFMPRNEEELMRMVIALSSELRYVHDLPQIAISFHKQEESELFFTVIIVHPETPRFKEVVSHLQKLSTRHAISIESHETRQVGLLRKRYRKIGHILELHIPKQRFLRKDFSVDFYEARRYISQTLEHLLGDFRDYNGGMISKQSENLTELKSLLSPSEQNNLFLLENLFYSITPVHMQSLLPPPLLKGLFDLFIQAMGDRRSRESAFFGIKKQERGVIILVATYNVDIRERFYERVHSVFGPLLTSSATTTYDLFIFGYLLENDEMLHKDELICAIEQEIGIHETEACHA